MNWNDIRVLYGRELRSALRERSIVVNSILIPILLYPTLLWLVYTGITFVSGQTSEINTRVALVNFPAQHQELRRELGQDKRIQIVEAKDSQAELKAGRLDLVVEFHPEADNNFRVSLTY